MRILQLHCRYTRPGGEDAVAAAEAELLRSRGHEVLELRASNADVVSAGVLRAARTLLASAWNRRELLRLRRAIREFCPDIVHVHNFWFVLSPSVFGAARAEGVPAVMTLHNYRLLCPGALLMRGGTPCEVCVGRSPWRAVPRGCYRGSRVLTAAVARMLDHNRRRRTWDSLVTAYVALSEFSRRKFIEGGLRTEMIHVKPNFLARDPSPARASGEGALYVGRLSHEKGVQLLVEAWRSGSFPRRAAKLTVVGDGPEQAALERLATSDVNVTLAGRLQPRRVIEEVKGAAFVVVPSVCYENFPRAILEAFACGRPVVASRLGAMAELVDDGRTGLLFEPGNASDLAEKTRFLLDNPRECERMGREARAEFESRYTADGNYEILMSIYERAIQSARRGRTARRQ